MALRLTDEQLEQLMRTAQMIPRELRGWFLKAVAEQLPSEPGDGELYRACARARKEIMWNDRCEASKPSGCGGAASDFKCGFARSELG